MSEPPPPAEVLRRCRWLLAEAAHALAHEHLTTRDRAALAASLFDEATALRRLEMQGRPDVQGQPDMRDRPDRQGDVESYEPSPE